jgi:hypothetical protein
MKKLSSILLLALLSFSNLICQEWIRVLNPDSVSIAVSPTKRVVEIETWKLRGHKNFINLSFWGSKGPVGSLYVNSVNHGNGKKTWPVISLNPFLGEYKGGEILNGFSGSNVLVRNGSTVKQGRSFFSRRNCPRTGVGVTKDGKLIIIVTTSATLSKFAKRFQQEGAIFAINVDGGSSTMFIENGESLWNSKRSAVPVILSW